MTNEPTETDDHVADPREWLTDLGAPVRVEGDQELHHPDDPAYDAHVQERYERRVARSSGGG